MLDLTRTVAIAYVEVYGRLRVLGRPIPMNDMWIAATCMALDLPLLARDQHFRLVEGLQLVEV